MEATIEVDVRVDQIELRNMRPVFSLDKAYERAVEVSGRCIITYLYSIRINDEVNLARLPGLLLMRGSETFTRPQSDKNGDILGLIRYQKKAEPAGSFEGSPARFVIELGGFDLNLLASFVPAIRPVRKPKALRFPQSDQSAKKRSPGQRIVPKIEFVCGASPVED